MIVKDLQKILQQALTYFTKYKPSDVVFCDIGEDYSHNYWNAPYMTVDNGDLDRCGIALSNKSRDGANQVMTADEFEKFLEDHDYDGPDNTFQIRNIKRILTDATRKLKDVDPEEQVKVFRRAENVEKPFVCLCDNDEFFFVPLNNIEINVKEPIEETTANDMYVNHKFNESKTITFSELKTIICESQRLEGAKRGLLEWAEIFIEDNYRNDIEGYDNQTMEMLAREEQVPEYNKIVDGILKEYKSYLTDETIMLLKSYKDGKFVNIVESTILDAIKNFTAGLSYDA